MRSKRILSRILLFVLAVCLVGLIYSRLEERAGVSSPDSSAVPTTEAAVAENNVPTTPTPTPEVTEEPEPTRDPELPDIDLNDWKYKLVNETHYLSSSFIPEVTKLENEQYFDSRAAEYLEAFIAAAREQGLDAYVSMAYRTYSAQEFAFNGKASQIYWGGGTYEEAVEKAKEIVAFPGTSEHQLGLAADIMDKYYSYMDTDLIGSSDTLIWMREHCAEYGFILRYPEDKEEITGFSYEPWHFRYVGEEVAAYIMEHDLCFEEFLALYN